MFGFVARFCLFGLSPDLVRLVLAFAFGCSSSFWFLGFLTLVLITELVRWFKKCWPSRRHRRAVAMLGRMIALHHRMTQNAADMMQLIQETLNQADEAHSRRYHDGQGRLRQQHVRDRSLAESSRPRAPDHAGFDEVDPPGPVMLNSVNSETPTDPPPTSRLPVTPATRGPQAQRGGQPQVVVPRHHHGGHQRGYRPTLEEPHGARLCWSAEHQEGQYSPLHHGQEGY